MNINDAITARIATMTPAELGQLMMSGAISMPTARPTAVPHVPTVAPQMPKGKGSRQRGSNSKVYVISHKGRLPSTLHRTGQMTLDAIKRAGKAGISAYELERKTGLVKKSVESSVWFLRSIGLVKSIAAK